MSKIIKARYKAIAVIVAVAILTLIAAVWYKNNVYPFRYSENIYEENKEHLDNIVDYFESFDDIDSAQMNTNGTTEIVSIKGSEQLGCSSDKGYKSLQFLREKYIKDSNKRYDSQSYMLNFIKAEYDDNGKILLKIPVS